MNSQEEQNYSRYLIVETLDEKSFLRAGEVFSFYACRGVLTNSSFDDDIWEMNNEKSRTRIRFDYSDVDYRKKAQGWTGCTSGLFRKCAKAYVAFQIGILEMYSIHRLSAAICRIAGADAGEAETAGQECGHVAQFLEMLPGANTGRDYVIEFLEDMYAAQNVRKTRRRQLIDFKSYFRFDEEVNSFWETADDDRRLFYFPVYFWWTLTAVLPLRVTEFLMVPADCINDNGGTPAVKVRRTRLKGGFRGVTYKISGDYETDSYPVSGKVASAVKWYQEKTAGMPRPTIDSLFRRQAMFLHKGNLRDCAAPESPYCYRDLSNTLKLFYMEELAGKGIGKINLGDTRHIAMMNLIISGGSPSMCMELAGHEDINISSHYYANMSNLVECATYELYRRKEKTDEVQVKGERTYSLEPVQDMVRMEGGWCASPLIRQGDVSDCIRAVGDGGELGDCLSCRYFRPDMQGVSASFYDKEKGKRKVDADSWFLMQMMESVRKGIGCREDILGAMLRLQSSCVHYRECILSGLEKGD